MKVYSSISVVPNRLGIPWGYASPVQTEVQVLTENDDDNAERSRALVGTGPSLGRRFFERLLLSLIDAHPGQNVENLPDHIFHDREGRLRTVMDAVFNEKGSDELPDHSALLWMAQQHLRDRTMHYAGGKFRASGVKPRSKRQLAQEASEKFYPEITDRSERLRKKWRKKREFWLAVARGRDDVLESVETQALGRIWIALSEAGVAVVPNWPDGRRMSEEQMLRTGFRELERLVELLRRT